MQRVRHRTATATDDGNNDFSHGLERFSGSRDSSSRRLPPDQGRASDHLNGAPPADSQHAGPSLNNVSPSQRM